MGSEEARPEERSTRPGTQPDPAGARAEAMPGPPQRVPVINQDLTAQVGNCDKREAKPYTAAELAWRPDPGSQSRSAQQWRAENAELRNKKLDTDGNGYYTVKHGDDLGTIAMRSLRDQGKPGNGEAIRAEMSRIVNLNFEAFPGLEKNPHLLRDGAKLRIADCNGHGTTQMVIPPVESRTERPDRPAQRADVPVRDVPRGGPYDRYGDVPTDGRVPDRPVGGRRAEIPTYGPPQREGAYRGAELPVVQPPQRGAYNDGRYADPRYADPRYADPRYGDPRYGDPRYGDPRYADRPVVRSSYGYAEPYRDRTGEQIAQTVLGVGLGILGVGMLRNGFGNHHGGFRPPIWGGNQNYGYQGGYQDDWRYRARQYPVDYDYGQNYGYSRPPYQYQQQQRPIVIVNNNSRRGGYYPYG